MPTGDLPRPFGVEHSVPIHSSSHLPQSRQPLFCRYPPVNQFGTFPVRKCETPHHRQQCASRRSTAYYQTAAGKGKKKTINGRRCGCPNVSSGHHPTPPDHTPPDVGLPDNHASPEPATPDAVTQAESATAANRPSCGHDTPAATADPVEQETSDSGAKLRVAGVVLDEARVVRSPVLPYIRMVASLIEGRHIGLAELIRALRNAVRQHKLARRRRVDYVLQCLNQHPP